jgi:xanthine dehydrogenase accessory factor
MRFFERIADLEQRHESFAVATVVSRRSPVSSHLGDRALVFGDGRIEGFVGGSCARDIVRRQAVEVLRSGTPRMLHIRPDPPAENSSTADGEHIFVPMSCASEGAVDVYIEPHAPSRRLVVAGFTPVADALVRLGATLGYAVVRAVDTTELGELEELLGVETVPLSALEANLLALDANERGRLVAIVASQGHYDEAALDVLLRVPVGFVGLLASRKRAARVLGVLAQQGHGGERLATIRNPVGLDIGARSPGEVAVSIVAEVIAAGPRSDSGAAGVPHTVAVDPVCDMDVETANARHVFTHGGTAYYFCCASCRVAFETEPARYLASSGRA